MNRRSLLTCVSLASAAFALLCVFGQGLSYAAYVPPTTVTSPLAPPCNSLSGPTGLCTDYFGVANYANTELPEVAVTVAITPAVGDTTGSGATAVAYGLGPSGDITSILVTNGGSGYTLPPSVTFSTGTAAATAEIANGKVTYVTVTAGGTGYAINSATGIHKFVDSLPTPLNTNLLGQTMPVATPDTSTFPGSDYYVLGIKDWTEQMNTDLPPTKIRGYYQIIGGTDQPAHYMGPLIIAEKDRPVRLRVENHLGLDNAGDLFLPTDSTYMSAGQGPLDNSGASCDPDTRTDCAYYTENRAVVHLHGGLTPWISDGTPQQYTTPAGQDTPFKKGPSFQDVPDMITGSTCADPTGTACITPTAGDGIATHFYTNQQSGRLLFYHDHVYGMTRLNVYAGEAAGYLIVNPAEESALKAATVPGTIPDVTAAGNADLSTADVAHLVPLVIQDKSFVPPVGQLNATDPTWDTTKYGGEGNLWFPHVYMPNQNPWNPTVTEGANAYGRWDYGPWFWPPQTSLTAGNGALTVPCTSAAFPGQQLQCPIIPNPSGTPESFMDTMVVNGTAYPYMDVEPRAYRFQILNASNDRTIQLSLFYAATPAGSLCSGANPPSTCTEVNMVPAVPHSASTIPPLCTTATATNPAGLAVAALSGGAPLNGTGLPANCWPTTWPTDSRDGGVPDPTTAGPPIIQIGTESGLLPKPAVIPATPIGYEYNRRNIVVLNTQTHSLILGPAERAEVIVDFSQVPAGSSLILYNDMPAPDPGFDTRYDYYTGDPDQTSTGGAPPTQPGYGPNTRTVMQFRVSGTPTATFSLPAMMDTATWKNIFSVSQGAPVVPETAFNNVLDTQAANNTYSAIQDTSLTFTPYGSTSPTTIPMKSKTIQELFTLDYGRMNATLGTELPLTNFLTQTTIPLGYIDPPTEIVKSGQLQLWKITHNGVDTHSIHFHLFDVQLINRVGWDGAIRQPDDNEVGWKDVVRMNPLEDVIVALRPRKPQVPFWVPDSVRLLDTTRLPGTTSQFTNIDPYTNQPITVLNEPTNFGWEYVWHCHLLGHEENDMMRAVIFDVNAKTKLLWRHDTAGVDVLWNMDGLNITNLVALPVVADTNWQVVATGDFNHDSIQDVVWRNTSTGDDIVWLMTGADTVGSQPALPTEPDLNWKIVGTGDFSGNGETDILWRNQSTGQNRVYMMKGLTLQSIDTTIPAEPDTAWTIAGTGDFNSDGKPDIVWRNTSTGANRIWYMNGTSLISSVALQTVPDANWQIAGIGDFNDDVYPDILWRHVLTTTHLVWLMKDATIQSLSTFQSVPDVNWHIQGR